MHPYSAALLGGALIGLASALLMLFNGRILGVSGILKSAILPEKGDVDGVWWRWAFLAGMLVCGWASFMLQPQAFAVEIERSLFANGVAGLLVGLGTAWGSGCTSGHGICGISRLSLRSIVATLVFMFTGGITVYIIQHLLGGRI